jgi:plastocyanin
MNEHPQPPARTLSRRRFLTLLGVGAFGLSAAGCAGLEPDFVVEMLDGNTFRPATLVIPRGTTVLWRNRDTTLHTATFDPDAVSSLPPGTLPQAQEYWDSGNVHSGNTWRHTFGQVGNYLYFCRYHVNEGMVATITVVE